MPRRSEPPDIITMELEVETPGAGPVTTGVEERGVESTSVKVKRRLGRFTVLGTLGRGGMGTVLEAYDETLARTVALKLLHGRVVESRRERLLREAQAMAQLSHPNVVQVYEVGVVEDQMFIAMELVEGENLRVWQKRRRPWRQVVEVYLQAGRGLAAAHAEGLVHRDFKPENCMIGDKGRVRVLDFGLARGLRTMDDASLSSVELRAMLDDSSLMQKLTQSGKVLGTVSYLPMQQLMGMPSDERSDQFSYCVSLYEALYGVLPYRDESLETLLDAQEQGRLQPVSRSFGVPRRLRRVLLRGLARDPRDRWPSMRDLLEALERIVHPRRWRAAAAISTLAVGIGIGVFGVSMQDDPCADPRAELEDAWGPADRASVRDAYLGSGHPKAPVLLERVEGQLDSYTEQWATMYGESCHAGHADARSQPQAEQRMQCLRRHRGRLRATIDALAGVSTPGEALERTVLPFKLPVLESCGDPSAEVEDDESPSPGQAPRVAALREQVDHANTLGQVGAVVPAIDAAVLAVEGARRLDHPPILAEALETLGRLQAMGPEPAQAEPTLQEAIQVAAQAHDDSSAARAWTSLLYAVMVQRDYERAAGLGFAATAAVERAGDEVARAWLLTNLGTLHSRRGEHRRACELHREALDVQQQRLGPMHIDVAVAWSSLGEALVGDGRSDEARGAFERARAILGTTVGTWHPHVATVETGLGRLAADDGDLSGAVDHYLQALDIRRSALGPHDIEVARALEPVADIRRRQGRLKEAARHLQRALTIYEGAVGPNAASVGRCALQLAELEWERKRPKSAEALARRAATILDGEGTAADAALAQFMLARVYYARPKHRADAHGLALAAREQLEDGPERARIEAWLDDHPAPPDREVEPPVTPGGPATDPPSADTPTTVGQPDDEPLPSAPPAPM